VFVLGASGLLGSTLVPRLVAHGHDVIAHTRTSGSTVAFDLTDEAATTRAMNAVRPDVVINLVGATDVDACERTPQIAYLGNVYTAIVIARSLQTFRSSCHLVHMSTDQVYNGNGPHREDSVTLTNYYSFSKFAGELAAATVPSTILRTNFFGRSQSAKRSSLSDWIVRSLTNRQPITVFTDVLFTPLSLGSLSSIIELVIQNPVTGTFNLGSRDGMSKADFAFALARVVGLDTATVTRGTSNASGALAYRPKDMRLNSERFECAFGITLPTFQAEIESMKSDYASSML
jgi:dTDP-4-dehydrorhamnose reductase